MYKFNYGVEKTSDEVAILKSLGVRKQKLTRLLILKKDLEEVFDLFSFFYIEKPCKKKQEHVSRHVRPYEDCI